MKKIEEPWQQELRLQRDRSNGLHGRDVWYDHDEEGIKVEGSSKFYTEPRTNLNRVVLALRLEYDYSTIQLAELLGCHANTVWKMERKRYVPNFDIVSRLKSLAEHRGMLVEVALLRPYLQPGAQRGKGRLDSTSSKKPKGAFGYLTWRKRRFGSSALSYLDHQ